MLHPRKIKFRKYQTKRLLSFSKIWSKKNRFLNCGLFGLRSNSFGILKSSHFECIRIAMARKVRQRGVLKAWYRVFPSIPFTRKPNEVRMGKGKGVFSFWGTPVFKGCVFLELGGIDLRTAILILKYIQTKLSFKASILIKSNI